MENPSAIGNDWATNEGQNFIENAKIPWYECRLPILLRRFGRFPCAPTPSRSGLQHRLRPDSRLVGPTAALPPAPARRGSRERALQPAARVAFARRYDPAATTTLPLSLVPRTTAGPS